MDQWVEVPKVGVIEDDPGKMGGVWIIDIEIEVDCEVDGGRFLMRNLAKTSNDLSWKLRRFNGSAEAFAWTVLSRRRQSAASSAIGKNPARYASSTLCPAMLCGVFSPNSRISASRPSNAAAATR